MASIMNVSVKAGDTALISEGTGTYDKDTRTLVCVGQWDKEPSVDTHYHVSFESVEPYGQPFADCTCIDFEKGGEATGTFVNKG
ncbi:MAG: hypothetical protein INR73_25620 [Williamsia sp.]|nr:hypothetical protein [Williamsia sp.]